MVIPLVKARKVVAATRRLTGRYRAWRQGKISFAEFDASVQGWINHARYADTWALREQVLRRFDLAPGSKIQVPKGHEPGWFSTPTPFCARGVPLTRHPAVISDHSMVVRVWCEPASVIFPAIGKSAGNFHIFPDRARFDQGTDHCSHGYFKLTEVTPEMINRELSGKVSLHHHFSGRAHSL